MSEFVVYKEGKFRGQKTLYYACTQPTSQASSNLIPIPSSLAVQNLCEFHTASNEYCTNLGVKLGWAWDAFLLCKSRRNASGYKVIAPYLPTHSSCIFLSSSSAFSTRRMIILSSSVRKLRSKRGAGPGGGRACTDAIIAAVDQLYSMSWRSWKPNHKSLWIYIC